MYQPDDDWSVAQSDSPLEEHTSTWEIEDFTSMSEENLRILKRSFLETLRQRKSHLSLLMNIKDCPNKESMIEEIESGIQSLEHDLRCLSSEIDSRKHI